MNPPRADPNFGTKPVAEPVGEASAGINECASGIDSTAKGGG